jgi:hypothetical protein
MVCIYLAKQCRELLNLLLGQLSSNKTYCKSFNLNVKYLTLENFEKFTNLPKLSFKGVFEGPYFSQG